MREKAPDSGSNFQRINDIKYLAYNRCEGNTEEVRWVRWTLAQKAHAKKNMDNVWEYFTSIADMFPSQTDEQSG